MKFVKPKWEETVLPIVPNEVIKLYNQLPDEFEILGPGEVAVKWPRGVTKRWLDEAADVLDSYGRFTLANDVRSLAAIAPERKNPTKRRISVLQFQGHGETYGKLELSFNMAPQFPWVKVGECEIEE